MDCIAGHELDIDKWLAPPRRDFPSPDRLFTYSTEPNKSMPSNTLLSAILLSKVKFKMYFDRALLLSHSSWFFTTSFIIFQIEVVIMDHICSQL